MRSGFHRHVYDDNYGGNSCDDPMARPEVDAYSHEVALLVIIGIIFVLALTLFLAHWRFADEVFSQWTML